jgi:hypothetical protein
MPIGQAAGMQIYEEQFYAGFSEVLEENANVFNEASAGAIRLVPRRLVGNYEQASFFTNITNLVTRRNTASVASVTDEAATMDELVSVKLNRKIGPIANTLDSFRKIGRDNEELSFVLGQQIGQAVGINYVSAIVTSLVAAMGAQSNARDFTGESTTTPTHTHLANMLSGMGDRSDRIVAWVMHSKSYWDLVGQAIADNVYEVAGVTIYTGNVASFGRPVIVTDNAALINTTPTPDEYRVLALVSGAAEVTESEEREIVGEVVTGLEQLVYRLQGEYAFNIGMRGYKWDMANGGTNPLDAAIGTASNWDYVMDDEKSGPGVLGVFQ